MNLDRNVRTIVAATVIAVLGPASVARAAELTFATIQSLPGLPSIFLDLTTFNITSFDVALPLDPSDPFAASSPIEYTDVVNGGTLHAFFKMGPIAPTVVIDPHTTAYGPGSFSIGINGGGPASIPWLTASFAQAILNFPVNIESGALFAFTDVTFSGPGFDATGLVLPGAFAFALGNPIVFSDPAGQPTGIGYQITPGALGATRVPEPASILLLGTGVAALCSRRLFTGSSRQQSVQSPRSA